MSEISDRRRLTITLFGSVVLLLTVLLPPGAYATDCTLPYWEMCFSEESQCVDCESFCSAHFQGQCEVEWSCCGEDEVYCPENEWPVLNECACWDGQGTPPPPPSGSCS